jgi:SAM-dependent methyltransferase
MPGGNIPCEAMKRTALTTESDRAWEELGKTDPYWAILEHGSRAKFFASGEEHVAAVLQAVHERIDPDYRPTRALDFGCGAGRVLIPLAQICDEVVGVDVSEATLSEARRNCVDRGLANVELAAALELPRRKSSVRSSAHLHRGAALPAEARDEDRVEAHRSRSGRRRGCRA